MCGAGLAVAAMGHTYIDGVGWVDIHKEVNDNKEKERISILDWGWGWEDVTTKTAKDKDMYREDYFRTARPDTMFGTGLQDGQKVVLTDTVDSVSNGGPSEYYDFPQGALTLNDLIEFRKMDFHRGNIFKACWRWGTKAGTTMEYDARKIIYSGCRLLMMLVGVGELRKTLQEILDDPQFKERDK